METHTRSKRGCSTNNNGAPNCRLFFLKKKQRSAGRNNILPTALNMEKHEIMSLSWWTSVAYLIWWHAGSRVADMRWDPSPVKWLDTLTDAIHQPVLFWLGIGSLGWGVTNAAVAIHQMAGLTRLWINTGSYLKRTNQRNQRLEENQRTSVLGRKVGSMQVEQKDASWNSVGTFSGMNETCLQHVCWAFFISF